MKQSIRQSNKITFLFFLVTFILKGQNIPFNCDYNAYLFQNNDVYSIDLASGNSYLVAENVTPGNINATAYNPADGFIWGSLTSPEKSIVRIGKDFETTTYYIDELSTSNSYVGDINSQGVYYLKGGGTTYYKVNLDPGSTSYTVHLATETLSQNISVHDWAFNAVDGNLYTVEKNSNILYRIDPNNGSVLSLGEVPILTGLTYTYGAVYFDASGRFYVSANQTGTIYVIQNVQDLNTTGIMNSNLFAFGPSSSSNDGARCPTAPVPQEICDNGIDDDGDGLVDCEDPSCSGYGSCPAILPPTSGANDGGLESNSRLSEKINKRSFNRAKSGYRFDENSAQRIMKTNQYAQKNLVSNIQLQDFIPLQIINEDYVINSTPSDLLSITNATEVFSVDYIENDIGIASILALKTENGVYEHTKYICDRLLGAELLSVSTIEINNQSFIKSLIKNTDGTIEFVLSLSAKIINNETDFAVESHWNLDKYEGDVTFYNFQIWSNSLDDLYRLGEEVLFLLNIEKPISSYNNSSPPTVFVKKGKYLNGSLNLEIVNTNATQQINFDAGFRTTETSNFDYTSNVINLGDGYITSHILEIGNLFDVGFRIGDGFSTPDDLFMSDGPWGIDDSQSGTLVNNYTVFENDFSFDNLDFPIERNIEFSANTNSYFAAYRALTPRFKAVDLTNYNTFKLRAKGTGNLEITIVKQSITDWQTQKKATIFLGDEFQDYEIPFSSFVSNNNSNIDFNDVVTIVFTMISENGMQITKNMELQNLRFSESNLLSATSFTASNNILKAFPNPMETHTEIHFTSINNDFLKYVLYNQLGEIVYQADCVIRQGENVITVERNNLSSGLYFFKIFGGSVFYKPLKIIVK
jgi:hypothetical protein